MKYKVVVCDSCSYKQHKNRYFVTQSNGAYNCPFCGKSFNFKNKVPPRVFFGSDDGRAVTLLVSKLNGKRE